MFLYLLTDTSVSVSVSVSVPSWASMFIVYVFQNEETDGENHTTEVSVEGLFCGQKTGLGLRGRSEVCHVEPY